MVSSVGFSGAGEPDEQLQNAHQLVLLKNGGQQLVLHVDDDEGAMCGVERAAGDFRIVRKGRVMLPSIDIRFAGNLRILTLDLRQRRRAPTSVLLRSWVTLFSAPSFNGRTLPLEQILGFESLRGLTPFRALVVPSLLSFTQILFTGDLGAR